MTTAQWTAGSLVRARGREWIVLPESDDSLLQIRPIGGLDEEVTAVIPAIEEVVHASFDLPDPERPGDHNACRLLRDAARLSTRAAAGPFRSFARIAVEPRPYQLVPLLMAMKLDPVRLLIADDVGIGKTIEAACIARELLDRGEVSRLAVLCPPHLAEQWKEELEQKFHIDAELVLSSTIQRLERGLPANVSVFERYPFVIVSTDFVKSPRRRDDFIRTCPELVIVDEAHGCTISDRGSRSRQYRFDLVRRLSEDETRHLVLVTATPHSGNEGAFRSLLSLLNEQFGELPEDLEGSKRESVRRLLARHLVQRRRADIRHYLDADTSFPDREDAELGYSLSSEHRSLFDKILGFAREIVEDDSGGRRHQRVRWWSALALLRSLASSPAAAAATLRKRADAVDADNVEEADELGRRAVLDQEDTETVDTLDFTPGSDTTDLDSEAARTRKRLLVYAREADQLLGDNDEKLRLAIKQIKKFVADGFLPLVFCRFIDTAEYVAKQLRDALSNVEVSAVTGRLPPAEREVRIADLVKSDKYVLVCTDCLSEGINLQDHFNAVMHYDLSWNPTRHEQREGRVDRFGQSSEKVRVLTYYGKDNGVDGVVLDVLIRKHKKIKSALGISVAVPGSSEEVVEAIFEGLLIRQKAGSDADALLPGLEEYFQPRKEDIHAEWDNAADREKRSRSRFAQHTINPDEVAAELTAIRDAIGVGSTTQEFVKTALRLARVPVRERDGARINVGLTPEAARSLRQALGRDNEFRGRFELPTEKGELYLARTSPIVEGLATWVLDTALDEDGYDEEPIARRCGVVQTKSVQERTVLLILRHRYHIQQSSRSRTILAEEIRPTAFTRSGESPVWLDDEAADELLEARSAGNLIPSLISRQLRSVIDSLGELRSELERIAQTRSQELLEAHTRVRQASRATGNVVVEPVLPVDVLGCFVYLPAT